MTNALILKWASVALQASGTTTISTCSPTAASSAASSRPTPRQSRFAVDVDAGLRHHEDRTPTHGDARGGDGGVRQELAAGLKGVYS
jgi:hypothetical protein